MNRQTQATRPIVPERWNFEGEDLVLVYNPDDPGRTQMPPNYDRLEGVSGGCMPLQFANQATGETINRYIVLAKVRLPPEPGTMVPEQFFRCFCLSDRYVMPGEVNWRTMAFYGVRPKDDAGMAGNEGQRFMNAMLAAINASAPEQDQAPDLSWTQDLARIQQQMAPPSDPAPGNAPEQAGPLPGSAHEDDA